MYDLEDRKDSTVLTGIDGYVLSQDGKKVLFSKGSDYGIADVKADQKTTDGLLALDKMTVRVDPRAEWQQQFTDAWRILRDWFYDPGMNGVNWTRRSRTVRRARSVRRRPRRPRLRLLRGRRRARRRPRLRGSARRAPRCAASKARCSAPTSSPMAGVFRVAKIYAGENWHEAFRSPLTEPGVNVKRGRLHPGGRRRSRPRASTTSTGCSTPRPTARSRSLVNGSPSATGAREERVRPIRSEQNLRYLEWVEANRRYVSEKSGGRIGYIHLPNTAAEGNRELFKWFYPQAAKDALIFDVRYNGGGFIPDRMLELVARPVLNFWARRGLEPTPTPASRTPVPRSR